MRRLLILTVLFTTGCTVVGPLLSQLNPIPTIAPTSTPAPTATPLPSTGTQFTVHVPDNTPPGSPISLVLVDEVTGNGLNDQKIPMGATGQNVWSVLVNLPLGALVKYKYIHEGQVAASEVTAIGGPVPYRALRVGLSAKVDDTVAGWGDAPAPANAPLGSLTGIIRDLATGQGVPGLIVLAGGGQSLTTWNGSYSFSRLPYGAQRVTAFAPDGAWMTTDGSAAISAPVGAFVDLGVNQARAVNVTFVVSIPADTDPSAPVRLAGSALQLGDTFGTAEPIPADRLVTLLRQADGRWTTTVKLYEAMDVRYRYTLGDGFWNAELNPDSSRPLRQLIVPASDLTAYDNVATWRTAALAPVKFDVTVPADTPSADTVTIQIKIATFSNPVPMWPNGASRWTFVLYNPLNFSFDLGYRYCRNFECGVADDATTAGANPTLKKFLPAVLTETQQDTVTAWQWWSAAPPALPAALPTNVAARPDFRAGFELGDDWHAQWPPRLDQTFAEASASGANFITVPSPWSVDPVIPRIDFDFNASPLPSDLTGIVEKAHARKLKVAIRPNTCRSPKPDCAYWSQVVFSTDWWGPWFDAYRNYLLYHADLAERAGAEMMYVGDYSLHPMLPGAPEASPDAEARWRALVAEVRQHYHGQLAFTVLLQNPQTVRGMPLFGDALDYIEVRWEAPVAPSSQAGIADMQAAAGQLIDTQVFQVFTRFNKPLGLSPRYLSVNGAALQCVGAVGQPCRPFDDFSPSAPDDGSV
ncbi:MAG: hypothetical protein HY023_07855, partial [Chloroflexi bacterium]|nr:hypothetical protein [Chloroflexota bacterium]